jgi:D-beta-D-heptose 7-phosphate kinase / D-beta-D-heptose 1-phosphate adenosyltransferase
MFSQARVAVVGDLILDEYISGEVTRISPEAPVPVHKASRVHLQAGGASNTALNLHLLGAQTILVGVIGDDHSGQELRNVLQDEGLCIDYLVVDKEYSSIKKTRITAGRQQIVRIDWEKNQRPSEKALGQCYDALRHSQFNVLLISDYDKGFLTHDSIQKFIKIAKDKKALIIVDPKSTDLAIYAGADLITPNLKEAVAACKDKTLEKPADIAKNLKKDFHFPSVLVTLGAKGMLLIDSKDNVTELPAQTLDVFDVSGAGDTVAASMAAAMGSATMDIYQAMEIANTAAGLVVQKWGTQPIRLAELMVKLKNLENDSDSKIIDLPNLKSLLGPKNQRSKKIVFTNGCFDILHFGHLKYLEKAKQLGDILVVGINSDSSVKAIKGAQRPVHVLNHRAGLLAGLSCVDYIVSFELQTPHELIKEIMPDVLVKGADYTVDTIIGAKDVIASGGEVVTIELVAGLSTSTIVEKMESKK